MRFILKRL